MARNYGQNIKISLNQCHLNIHHFYTKYIPVMYNERCSMQRYASKRCSIKLKDEETNVIQVFDVRGHKEIFVKTKRSAIKLKDEEAKVIQA